MNAEAPQAAVLAAPRTAWILPALRTTIPLVLCGSAVAVVLGSLILAVIFGSSAIAAAGLLSGAVLGACGGLSLLWVLSSLKK